MTTVFKSTGFLFSNENLPILHDFYSEGLVGAYRFVDGNITDLSGNGNDLITIGSPVVSGGIARGGKNNGYDTGIIETKNVTLIAVSRPILTGSSIKAFAVGNYQSLSTSQGSSIFYQPRSGENKINAQTFTKNTDTDISSLNLYDPRIIETDAGFYFSAISISGDSNVLTQTVDGVNYSVVSFTPPKSLAMREIPLESQSNASYLLLSNRVTGFDANVEVLEVLIYNRALTQPEIEEQYNKSKRYASSLGFDI